MAEILTKLWKNEEGQDLTEYALVVALLALATVASMADLATAISQAFSSAAANITAT